MHLDESGKVVIKEIQFDDEAEFNQFPPGLLTKNSEILQK